MAHAAESTDDSTSRVSEVSRSDRESGPLHLAASQGDLPLVRSLVQTYGHDVDARDTYGRTPMHWASEEGRLEVMQYLVEQGADIRIPDGVARTPLHWAAFGGHLVCVIFLREKGAHLNTIDCEQKTALFLASSFGHFDVVQFLISQGASVHVKTKYNSTALQIAAKHGHLQIVQHLVKCGAKINFENIFHKTPLVNACCHGHVHIAQFLINNGAKMHKNILHDFYDKAQVTTLLIENGASLNTINTQGETVLHRACEAGKVAVVRALLAHRPPSPLRDRFRRLSCGSQRIRGRLGGSRSAVDVDAVDRYQRTALHRACEKAHVEVARLLVEHDANVAVTDVCGRTPLHWACEAGNLELTRLLLSHGSDASIQDGEGESPLMWAAEGGHTHVARLLVQHHANITVKSEDGRTALHWAVEGGHLEIVRLLIQYGAYAHVVDEYGWNLLHRACIKGHLQVVKCLVQHRADVQSVDGYGRTSLHWSCKVANVEVSKFLIEHGADVMAVDWGMRTPLHWVCGGGLLQVQSRQLLASLLVRKCASVHALDMQQCTPLHLACKNGLLELTSSLINLGAYINSMTDSGKAFILELLNKFVKKYILSNILQENAIVPVPRGGIAVDIQLQGDLNTMQTVEPERIQLFYQAGFQFSRLVDYVADLRRRDVGLDNGWAELLDFLSQRENQVHRLSHLCRLNIRAKLGTGIKAKIDKLSIYRSLPPDSANTSYQADSETSHQTLLKLPTQLKDYLSISEINN